MSGEAEEKPKGEVEAEKPVEPEEVDDPISGEFETGSDPEFSESTLLKIISKILRNP